MKCFECPVIGSGSIAGRDVGGVIGGVGENCPSDTFPALLCVPGGVAWNLCSGWLMRGSRLSEWFRTGSGGSSLPELANLLSGAGDVTECCFEIGFKFVDVFDRPGRTSKPSSAIVS